VTRGQTGSFLIQQQPSGVQRRPALVRTALTPLHLERVCATSNSFGESKVNFSGT
jgi:hypothetical protein